MSRLFIYFTVFFLVSDLAIADSNKLHDYQIYIDNYQNYSLAERDRAIQEIIGLPTKDIEKNYLLGMLYYIQSIDEMNRIKSGSEKKLKITQVVEDKTVSKYILNAKMQYDQVESSSPGYKYIYCKYGELYRDTYNIQGLRETVRKVGSSKVNPRSAECKDMLENIAIQYSQYGEMGELVTQAIFEEMTKSWDDYPKYILEPLGDIAQFQNNTTNNKLSHYWWNRCVSEVVEVEIRDRCAIKLKHLNNPNNSLNRDAR